MLQIRTIDYFTQKLLKLKFIYAWILFPRVLYFTEMMRVSV